MHAVTVSTRPDTLNTSALPRLEPTRDEGVEGDPRDRLDIDGQTALESVAHSDHNDDWQDNVDEDVEWQQRRALRA
jgi:hypothetical protein